MNRLVFRVTAPGLLIGLLLSLTCLTAAWQINRLQRGLMKTLPTNVTAVEAAQKLEILHRELRFLVLQERLNPTPRRRREIDEIHQEITRTLQEARAAAHDPEQQAILARIDRALQAYLPDEEADLAPFRDLGDIRRWTDEHPAGEVASGCRELLEVNNREMREAAAESDFISRWVQAALLIFCMIGPIGGFVGGFSTARSMHQSITRMLVLVRDVHAQLDREVGLLEVDPETPTLSILDERLEKFVERVREVTRQVQRQQQEILRSEQLAAVGQLAAAVAHEIRNPLTGIKLLVEAARSAGQELTASDLAVIHRELTRLERTVQGLLDYARPPALRGVRQDIRPTIAQAVELVGARAVQVGAEVRVESPAGPLVLWHDRDQIKAVLTNLLFNALDALRQGGSVTVSVERGRGCALIHVRDTGPGLAEAILPRLFTPFASTKATGTGLGLSLSLRIARQHGGNLTAANHPRGGACFTLTLTENGPGGSNA